MGGTGEFVDGAAEGTRRDTDQERNVLQCVAVFCSVLHCVLSSVLQCIAVYYSVLQCIAVCCGVLQFVAVWPNEHIYT